jgi:hypothetical protein
MPIKKLTSAVDTMAGPCEDETTTLGTTMADHTTASALGADAETTVVVTDTMAAPLLAWSEGDEPPDTQRHPWGHTWELAATIIACTALLAGALIAWHVVLGHHRGDFQASALSVRVPHSVQWGAPGALTTVAAAPPSAPSVVTTVTEPPVTVTVTPTPTTAPATTAAAVPESQDDRYVDALRQHGIAVYDRSRANDQSHWICGQAANGRSATDIASAMRTSRIVVNVTVPQSEFLVTQAIAIYCPEYGDGSANY